MSMMTSHDLPGYAADLLERLRARRPRVHCLMNTVAQKLVADGLSALGAIPSMTSSPEEVTAFVAKADALTVNLGTLDAARREAIRLALDAAAGAGRPWVLDPAHCDYSPPRAAFAQELLARGPAVLRANAAEFGCVNLVPSGMAAVIATISERFWASFIMVLPKISLYVGGLSEVLVTSPVSLEKQLIPWYLIASFSAKP